MEKINIEIPENMKFLKSISNINWTILVGKIIQSELSKIQEIQGIQSESKLTEKDLEELEKHKLEIKKRTKLSEEKFEKIYSFLLSQIVIIPKSEFKDSIEEAK